MAQFQSNQLIVDKDTVENGYFLYMSHPPSTWSKPGCRFAGIDIVRKNASLKLKMFHALNGPIFASWEIMKQWLSFHVAIRGQSMFLLIEKLQIK